MSEVQTPTIPYSTFPAVEAFIGRLADLDAGPPDHVDRSMLGSSMSGADQTALLKALEFLGLISMEDGSSSTALRGLVAARRAGDEEWKLALKKEIDVAFEGVIGDLNVPTTTPAKLEAAFKAAGVKPGQMLSKSIRFYLKSLQAYGVTLPPHLATVRSLSKATAKKAASKKKAKKKNGPAKPLDGQSDPSPTDGDPAEGFERLPLLGGLGFIQFKSPATEQTCKVIEGAAGYLRITLGVKEGEER